MKIFPTDAHRILTSSLRFHQDPLLHCHTNHIQQTLQGAVKEITTHRGGGWRERRETSPLIPVAASFQDSNSLNPTSALLPSHHCIPSTTSSLPSHPITHPPFIHTPLHPATLLMLSFFLLNRKSRERADNLCHYETLLHIKGRESFISGCHTTPFLLFARITRDLFHSNSKTLHVDFHHQDQHGVPASSTR